MVEIKPNGFSSRFTISATKDSIMEEITSTAQHEKLTDYSKRRASFPTARPAGSLLTCMEMDGDKISLNRGYMNQEASRIRRITSKRRASSTSSGGDKDKELRDAISTTEFLLSLPVETNNTTTSSTAESGAHNISLSSIDNSTGSVRSSGGKSLGSALSLSATVHRRRSLQDRRISCSDRLRMSLSFQNQSIAIDDSSNQTNASLTARSDHQKKTASSSSTRRTSPSDMPKHSSHSYGGVESDNHSSRNPSSSIGASLPTGSIPNDVKFNLRRRSFNVATAKRASLHAKETGDNDNHIPVSSSHRLQMSLSSLMMDESVDGDGDNSNSDVVPDHRRRHNDAMEESSGHTLEGESGYQHQQLCQQQEQPRHGGRIRQSLLAEESIIMEYDEEEISDRTAQQKEASNRSTQQDDKVNLEKPRIRVVGKIEPLMPKSIEEQAVIHQERRARRKSRASLGGPNNSNVIATATVALWNSQPKSKTELSGMIHHQRNKTSLSSSLGSMGDSFRQRRSRSRLVGTQSPSPSTSATRVNAQWSSQKQSSSATTSCSSSTKLGMRRSLSLAVPSSSSCCKKQLKSGNNLESLLRKANRRSAAKLNLSSASLSGQSLGKSNHSISSKHNNAQWRASGLKSETSSSKLNRLTASFTDMMDASTGDLLHESLHKPSVTARQKTQKVSLAVPPRDCPSKGNALLEYIAKKKQRAKHNTQSELSPTSTSNFQNAQWNLSSTSVSKATPSHKGSPISSTSMNRKLAKLASLNRSVSTSTFAQQKAAAIKAGGHTKPSRLTAAQSHANFQSRIISLVDLKERFEAKSASLGVSRQPLSINTSGAHTTASQDNLRKLAELKKKLLNSSMGTATTSTPGNHNAAWNSHKATTKTNPFLSIVTGNQPVADGSEGTASIETPLTSNKRVKALAPDGITVISRNSSFSSAIKAVSSETALANSVLLHSNSSRSTSLSLNQKQRLLQQLGTTSTVTGTRDQPNLSGLSQSQSQSRMILGRKRPSSTAIRDARSSSCLTQMLTINQDAPSRGAAATNLASMLTENSDANILRMGGAIRRSRQNLKSDSIRNDPSYFVTGSRIRRYQSSGGLASTKRLAFPDSFLKAL